MVYGLYLLFLVVDYYGGSFLPQSLHPLHSFLAILYDLVQ